MTAENSFSTICSYLPEGIRQAFLKVDSEIISRLTEVRLYCGRGAVLMEKDKAYFISRNGRLNNDLSSSDIIVVPEHMKHILTALSRYSFHSHESELTDGRFVLENGVRAGVCGTFSNNGNGIVRDVSSVSFRIAREIMGCADNIAEKYFGRDILICGAVNSGKTTILRDLCRIYGDRVKCTLVDERNEISASKKGIPSFSVGVKTDIIIGRNRHDSIIGAVRTLSPYYIFCDEIADEMDTEAIDAGIGCGSKFVATVHADNYSDLMKRRAVSKLIHEGAFDIAVFLERTGIKEVRKL